MNKMVKGAIATGVGIILLVGGGGTLATWNASSNASMGSVVSGDLNLTPVATGTWSNAAGTTIPDISKYKVVPGDTLTYTQKLNVTLSGDLMVAKLVVTGAGVDRGFTSNAVASTTALTDAKSAAVLATTNLVPANSGEVTAVTTFTFNKSTTARDAVNASFDFSGVGYKLEQQAPASSNNL